MQQVGEQSHPVEPRHFTRANCLMVNRSEKDVGGSTPFTARRPSTRAHPEEVSEISFESLAKNIRCLFFKYLNQLSLIQQLEFLHLTGVCAEVSLERVFEFG